MLQPPPRSILPKLIHKAISFGLKSLLKTSFSKSDTQAVQRLLAMDRIGHGDRAYLVIKQTNTCENLTEGTSVSLPFICC